MTKQVSPAQVAVPKQQMFVTWNEGDEQGKAVALYQAGQAVKNAENALANRSRGTDVFRNIYPGGMNVRDGFDRKDYEMFRRGEAIPTQPKQIIKASMDAYDEIGIIRNIIDLMGDFATQGIDLYHPNERIENFYREWFKKVNGKERSERFLNLLYRTANVIVKRTTAKLPVKVADDMRRASADVDVKIDQQPRVSQREVPWSYRFMSPLAVDVLSDELALFVGEDNLAYALKIPRTLARRVSSPSNEYEASLVSKMPPDIVKAVRRGDSVIALDRTKTKGYYYKKDDWQIWAKPMVYSILADLQLLKKMKLADLAALDGAISCIRVWKLGDLKERILPTEAAIMRLAEMLMNNVGGGVMDLVWGPAIDLVETKTDVHQFLGQTKYEPCLTAIYAGLGIPPTMTGASTHAGFTNNYISLKTLTERLQYGREQLSAFWREEIRIVQQAMEFRFPATIVFDRMTLTDEAAEKQLLLHMWDRGLVSDESIVDRFGEVPDIEEARVRRDERKRKNGMKPPKASPYHNPQQDFDLKKIFSQTGVVSPSEVGVELEEPKKGEKSLVELTGDQAVKTAKLQKDSQQQQNDHQFRTEKLQLKHGVHPAQQPQTTPVGTPGQGRPKQSKDTQKRKQKVVQPRSAAKFFQAFAWAENAQASIGQIAGAALLAAKGKKTLRELTDEEASTFERFKFFVLCSLEPNQTVDKAVVAKAASAKLTIPTHVDLLLKTTIQKHVEETGREPTLEVLRRYQAGVYALSRGQFDDDGDEDEDDDYHEETSDSLDCVS